MKSVLWSFTLSAVVTAVLLSVFIPILRKVKLGQKILEIGPNWHKSKEGTPTMGGAFFILAALAVVFTMLLPRALKSGDYEILIHFGLAFASGLIGFTDDYVKLFKKTNKGLSPNQKMVLQFIIAGAYLFLLNHFGYIDTVVTFGNKSLDLGVFYYIISVFVIVYLINSANLTDGIDGLAGSVAFVISVMFVILAMRADNSQAGIMAGAAAGGCIGFLIFNFYPAKVFMGDTGSMYLGGIVVGLCYMFDASIMIFAICGIYVIEGISVMLQVSIYKLTKKRIFKMAPIHHHFEMCGWSEVKIVGVFSLVTALLCGLATVFLKG